MVLIRDDDEAVKRCITNSTNLIRQVQFFIFISILDSVVILVNDSSSYKYNFLFFLDSSC